MAFDWSPAIGAYASTPGQKDWRGINSLINSDRLSRMNPFEFGAAQFGAAQENFGGQMQGAMGQIGGILQHNAAMQQQIDQRNFMAQQMEQERNDKNNKFSMLFRALIGDPSQKVQVGRDPGTGKPIQSMAYSPLMTALAGSIGSPIGMGMSSYNQVQQGAVPLVMRNPWMQ